MLEQALELAPDWAPAWFALGEAREKQGDTAGAAEAFRATLAADGDDIQGAGARLALLGAAPGPDALPPAYVARLFDDYAPRFDAHLRDGLGYLGPEWMAAALDRLQAGRRFSSCLDLGCGTGLAGVALRGRVDRLEGVDLSAGMIAKARETRAYDALSIGDAVAFLANGPAAAFDLIVAADVLVYIGDLAPVFAGAARALAPGGLFVFTVETMEGAGYRLGPAMRFAHSGAYIAATAARAGLGVLEWAGAPIRREAGRLSPGAIGVLARPEASKA